MERDIENIIIAGGTAVDIEAVILRNIIGEYDESDNGHGIEPFNLDEFPSNECKFNFRFEKKDIYRLSRALRMPDFIKTHKGNKVTGLTGLCIVLRRLSYPNRLRDLKWFGYSAQSLSLIINRTIELINLNHGHLLDNLVNLRWLTQERLRLYAQAIREKGGAVPNCWGFIDGTARAICRPTNQQENYYSGHKRMHCVKYQSVLVPDGIIASLKGGWPGRKHDAAMFSESNLYRELERIAVFPNGERYVLYGDQAYGVRELLFTPYSNRSNLNAQQWQFNASMKPLRLTVEWGFQKVIGEFAFVDFRKNQKLLLQDIESVYKVATLLTNCHTCIYGSQTAQYFNINAPVLEEYIGL